jgi:hypothetical protein
MLFSILLSLVTLHKYDHVSVTMPKGATASSGRVGMTKFSHEIAKVFAANFANVHEPSTIMIRD